MKATKAQLKEQRYLVHEIDVKNEVARMSRVALFMALCWCDSVDEYESPAEWLKQVNEQEIYSEVSLCENCKRLEAKSERLVDLLQKASRFNELSKTESAPAWDADSPFQQQVDDAIEEGSDEQKTQRRRETFLY